MIQLNGSEKGKSLSDDAETTKPQAMADSVPWFLDLGVFILDGCCGTTPTDLHAMSNAMGWYRRSRNPGFGSRVYRSERDQKDSVKM